MTRLRRALIASSSSSYGSSNLYLTGIVLCVCVKRQVIRHGSRSLSWRFHQQGPFFFSLYIIHEKQHNIYFNSDDINS